MPNEQEINAWIARLETEESSWSNYEKLAVLYAIRGRNEKQDGAQRPIMYSAAAAPDEVTQYGDTEFLQSIAGKSPEKLWYIMDELMDALMITNRKVYNSVLAKIRRIS